MKSELLSMDKLIFVTDLDHTLIHSQYPEHYCVEYLANQQPITYMTKKSYHLLQKVLSNQQILLVPCTMRSYQQIERISWFKIEKFPIIICLNGAQVYRYGKLDLEWETYIRSHVSRKEVSKDYQNLIRKLKTKEAYTCDIIADFYIVIKTEQRQVAEKIYPQLFKIFGKQRQVILQGRKIVISSQKIDKRYALEYLQLEQQTTCLITSGDSVPDQKFTQIGTAILPKHASFRHEGALITTNNGIEATEEILYYVLQRAHEYERGNGHECTTNNWINVPKKV